MTRRVVSPASTVAAAMPHLPSLDGLRGLAVLAVVAFHFSPASAPGGFLGVDVFFLLSGFLITSLLVTERERTQHISLRNFWARRARRLLPALFLLFAVLGAYALWLAPEVEGNRIGHDGLAALGYFANWHFNASGQGYVDQFLADSPSVLRHTWSLAIEEQFYLLWPLVVGVLAALVARVTRKSSRGPRRFRIALTSASVALAAASLTLMITMFSERNADRVYYGTDTRAFMLLFGAALGALTAGRLTVSRPRPRAVLVAAGALASTGLVALIARVQPTDAWLYRGGYGLVAALVAIVLVAAAQPGVNPLGTVLRARPLVGLGLISYGVYLWHWPISLWLTKGQTGFDGAALFALRASVTLAISLASFVLIEQPIRRGRALSWLPARRRVAIALALCTAALLAVPALTLASTVTPPHVAPTKATTEAAVTYRTVPRCDGALTPPAAIDAHGVTLSRSDGGRPTIQLVGNSLSVGIVPCLDKIVEQGGGSLETITGKGWASCNFLPHIREQVANPATRPDAAVWFSFDWFVGRPNNVLHACNTDWRQAPEEAIRIWTEAGVHVYLVPPPPRITPSSDPNLIEFRTGDGQVKSAPAQSTEFRSWAAQDPEHITLIDAGMFLRDANGAYQWRMPCVLPDELGCAPDGTIGVRWTDEFHFCSDPAYKGGDCAPEFSGGERRVAAAIALQIKELQSNKPPRSDV